MYDFLEKFALESQRSGKQRGRQTLPEQVKLAGKDEAGTKVARLPGQPQITTPHAAISV